MERSVYLSAFRCPKISTKFKGIRTSHKVTHSPSIAKPGDILTVTTPKIKDKLFLPSSFAMTFDFECVLHPAEPGTVVNNFPVNNLAANIISRLVIKINSDPIFDLDNAHIFYTFKDLWLTDKQRLNSVFKGIQDEELRRLRTDLKANLANPKASNVTLRGIFGKKYVLPLNFEFLGSHIPLNTSELDNIFFELTINTPKNVLKYSKTESIDFTLKNICLTYDTLDSRELLMEVSRSLDLGFQFLFDDVHHYKRETVSKSKKQFNIEVDVDRKSLKGILIIFQESFNDGERDSEYFPNPGIENINFTIDGLPNALYNGGYKQLHHWDEIFKHFVPEELKKTNDIHLDIAKYYNDNKYALWVDLRSTEDNSLHGTGKEQKENILMEVSKKDNGTGDYTMHIFVISDARIIIKNNKFQNIER